VGHHDGAVPVDGDKRPCQRAGHGGQVDEARVGVVAEVERGQVGEVQEQQHLGPGEVRVHEEEDEGGVEEVVGYEVCGPRMCQLGVLCSGTCSSWGWEDARLPTEQAALTDSVLDEKRCEM
jgi:hypothetical protein